VGVYRRCLERALVANLLQVGDGLGFGLDALDRHVEFGFVLANLEDLKTHAASGRMLRADALQSAQNRSDENKNAPIRSLDQFRAPFADISGDRVTQKPVDTDIAHSVMHQEI
jgi:hypothetical protein